MFQRILLAHVRAVGHHDAHCERHRIEELSHCGGNRFEQHGAGKALEIRQQIVFQTFRRAVERQGIDCNADRQQDEHRHHEFADALDTLFHAEHDDRSRCKEEDQEEDRRLTGIPDKAGEEGAVTACRGTLSGSEGRQIFQHPAADHAVIRCDDNRHEGCQPAERREFPVDAGISADDALSGSSADCDFRDHQREAEGDRENQVDQKKDAAAVLRRKIREAPDVAESDCGAGCCKDKSEL